MGCNPCSHKQPDMTEAAWHRHAHSQRQQSFEQQGVANVYGVWRKTFVEPCFECESGLPKSLKVFGNVLMLRRMN